jgi:hypothetical protein
MRSDGFMLHRFPLTVVVVALAWQVGGMAWGQSPPATAAPPPPAALEPATPLVDLDRMDRDAREALRSARAAVDAYLHAAQDAVERQLAADPQYRQAQDQTSIERRRLEDARAFGRPEAIRLAQGDYDAAIDHERRIRDAAYAASSAYQRARALSSEFAPPAPPPPDPNAVRIADAIAEHRLVTGMTLDEAMRALGPTPVLLESGTHVSRYRWAITARVGDQIEVHHEGFRRREVIVPRYRVVGHVTATFTDGRITDIVQDRI